MLVEQFFLRLSEIVNQIALQLPPKSKDEQKQMEKMVRKIRQISDSVLDEWIKFEELFDEKIRPHFPAALPSSPLEELKHEMKPPDPSDRSSFIKGQGYYELGMYQESFPYLEEAVQKEPDNQIARLFYAYCALFIGKKEESARQFRLLERTSANHEVRSICLNALGVIAFDAQQIDQALNYFKQAIEINEKIYIAQYNLGMVYYFQSMFRLAVQSFEEYLVQVQQWDIEVIFYLASCYVKLGEFQKAIRLWEQKAYPELKNRILVLFGQYFEEHQCYQEAIDCYTGILRVQPDHAEALHGVAWNQWLMDNRHQDAISRLKKALTLSPSNLNICFSLAWIYFQNNMLREAEKSIDWMLKQDSNFTLAISLSFLIALKRKDLAKAEEWALTLKKQKDRKPIALGELFMGKLKLNQGDITEAIQSFKRSVWNNPHLRESYLLQGLAHYLNKEPEIAERLWKKNQIIANPLEEKASLYRIE